MKKLLTLIFCIVLTYTFFAAPFIGQVQSFKQPDGTTVDVKLYGNEFYMRAEGLDGYTVVRDITSGWICYAKLSTDQKKLVSSGTVYHGQENVIGSLATNLPMAKHLDVLPEAQKALGKQNRTLLESTTNGSTHPTNSIDAKVSGTPVGTVSGNIKGLCIVVDFSDEVGTLPMSEFDNFCNDLNYSNFGNNGSLRKFYKDISGGLVDYQNVVYGYYRAPLTFAQYDAMPYAQGAQQILGLALNWINAQGFDFSTLSINPDGSIQAINLMYTGTPPNWAQGMWHHKGNYTNFSADGVHSNDYNCSPANNPLTLATVAHENGHMIGKWPDTYKYDNLSGDDGIGAFDLMCWYGDSYNPVPPNPLFRSNAGWGRVVDVTNYNGLNTDTANSMTCFKYRNINDTNEFFLLENRMKTGRSLHIPNQGLTIWHIDRNGDNQTTHHEVWLEHADNNYTNENNACFRSISHPTFCYSTTPVSNFYSGNQSGLKVWVVGTPTTNLTYKLGNGTAGPSLNMSYISLSADNNGNGFLEPAESANVNVNGFNFGQLSSANATISCIATGTNSGYVTVNTTPINVGAINVGQTVPATFNITVAANTPIGTEIELKFLLADGANSIYILKKIIVGAVILIGNQNDNSCSALFYDASGEINYEDNTDYTETLFPSNAGQKVQLNFVEFDVEDETNCGYDYLTIYDGPNTSSPFIGTYCGINSPGQVISTDATGALTFEFHSDSWTNSTGWKAIISCNTVSSVKLNSLSQFSLYPNPSAGIFNLRFNGAIDAQLKVVDVVGKEIYNSAIEAKEKLSLDLSDKPNGMYFIQLQIGKEVVTKKIVLNK